jgi:predicted transcriptional regulator
MKAAFILEDKSRLTLFNDLAKDRQTVKALTRKNHMLENVARRALDSMEEEGLVIREGDRYQLTVEGKGLVNKVRELERKGASREGVGESTGKRRIISPKYRT